VSGAGTAAATEPVVFIAQPGNEEPWYNDFAQALAPHVGHRVFEHGSSADGQFDGVRAVVDQGGHGTRPMIDEAARVGVVLWQVLGTGLDHAEVDYILGKGIKLANTPGAFSAVALAEHALLLLLCLAKNLREAEERARAGVLYGPMNDELAGKTLGLVGLGASGRELAKRAAALGMHVRALDLVPVPQEQLDDLGVESFSGPEGLHDLLGASDFVSLHVPLTRETQNLIDARALDAMRPGAALVNVARGAIVDEEALVSALRAGRLRGVGLDTLAREPTDLSSPLLEMDNVFVTPHVAGATLETSQRRAQVAVENVLRVLGDEEPLYEVGPAGA
jgi:phosphoglycerate dehydrogenase-like enzyme